MRKTLCLFAGLSAFCLSAVAAYHSMTPPRADVPAFTGLVAESVALDFGEQPQSETVTRSVKLKNTSPTTINIIEIGRGCSCTETKLDKLALSPNEEATLAVAWNLGVRRGETADRIDILHRVAPDRLSLLTLALKARVLPDILFEPSTVEFDSEIPKSVTVQFRPGYLSSFKLLEAGASHAGFTAKLDVEKQRVVLEIDPNNPSAGGSGLHLWVKSDSPREPRIVVPIAVRGGARNLPVPMAMTGN